MVICLAEKYSENELIESLKKVSVTHGVVLRGPQSDFLRLLKTLEQELPDLYIVYQTSSTGHLWIKRGEEEVTKT